MVLNLILSGGVAHDFRSTSRVLSEILRRGGIQSEIVEGLDILAKPELESFSFLTLNCVHWSCSQTPQWRDWAFTLSHEQREGLLRFLEAGKGVMALHAAVISFDTWPEYREILGGYWNWGESSHGPYRSGYKMYVVDRRHPITSGVGDFEIHDELYHTLRITRPVHLLLVTFWEERIQPMAWTTSYGPARIYYNALGHGVESLQCEEFQQLLLRGALWVLKKI